IPSLRGHLDALCKDHGPAAIADELMAEIDTVCEEIGQELDAQILYLSRRAEVQAQAQQQMEGAFDKARTFLVQELGHTLEVARNDMEAYQALLSERMRRAVERGQDHLKEALAHLDAMFWNSLRSMMSRGGRYGSSIDLSADIAK